MEETAQVWRQAFGKDRKQEVLPLGWNLQRKLKGEMWVPLLKRI